MRQATVYYKGEVAGLLKQDDAGHFHFRYADQWRAEPGKPSISLRLPKTKQDHFSEHLFPFFYHLLPEGDNRQAISQALRIDQDDDFGLLLHVAQHDTIGAVRLRKIMPADVDA